jgi:hypothetical protein
MLYRTIILFFLLFNNVSEGTQASAKAEKDEGNAPSVATENQPPAIKTTNSQLWLLTLSDILPNTLCKENTYYRKCYSVSESECKQFTKAFVSSCSNNLQLSLPKEIKDPQRLLASRMIGKCTFDLYEKFLADKYLDSKECQAAKQPVKSKNND